MNRPLLEVKDLTAGYIEDVTGKLDYAFYLSGGLLVAAVILSRFLRRPV